MRKFLIFSAIVLLSSLLFLLSSAIFFHLDARESYNIDTFGDKRAIIKVQSSVPGTKIDNNTTLYIQV